MQQYSFITVLLRFEYSCLKFILQFPYTDDDLALAIEAVLTGGDSYRVAAASFGIPKSTIEKKCKEVRKGIQPTVRHGRNTELSKENEKMIASHVIRMNLVGLGLDKCQLLDCVQDIANKLKLTTKFVDNRPTDSWTTGFLKRHNLSLRVAENVERGRTLVSEEKIRNWFAEIQQLIV